MFSTPIEPGKEAVLEAHQNEPESGEWKVHVQKQENERDSNRRLGIYCTDPTIT